MTSVVAAPTSFEDLNGLLDEFVDGVREILGANFVGAYLVGSFAVGDADEHSDVDWIVATDGEVTSKQEARLGELHARLYALETPWAQHLEGSYVPKERLRRVDPERSPFLFLDNGASELIRDPHCNSAVVRWSLREHGIPLAGPEPETLVDPVPPDVLREEARLVMRESDEWTHAPTKAGGMSRWLQAYIVLSFCRMLYTIATGVVGSKRVAGEWALDALDPEWRALIQQALDDRPDPWARVYQEATAENAERTFAFIRYARVRAGA